MIYLAFHKISPDVLAFVSVAGLPAILQAVASPGPGQSVWPTYILLEFRRLLI